MSSTEALSGVSSAPDSDHHHLKQTPTNGKRQKRSIKPKLDIQEEIDHLYDCVPQIKQVFEVEDRIGSGTFSSVYLATLREHANIPQQFALKHIIPTSHPSRIENELRCLQEIGGCDYVMGVKACIREKDHVVIVMPYFPHDRFQDYVQVISLAEIREYMHALLIALRRVHKVNIIHRDVKPSNFLYNRKTKEFSLVDFGLAMKVPSQNDKTDEKNTKANEKINANSQQPQPRRTSPRKPRKISPKKRKADCEEDAENLPDNGRRKRQCTETTTRLAELDPNVPSAPANATPTDNKSQYNQRAGGGTVKSPRRMLLTRRALDVQNQRGSGGGGGSGTTRGGAASSGGRTVTIQKNSAGKSVYKCEAAASPSSSLVKCQCYGKAQICSICIARPSQHASRAGTQGFRSPEVLMKFPDQTTAVDIWSAGVIFLSLLSGRYPFFKASDDLSALAQIISIFGAHQMKEAAVSFGKNLLCHPNMPSLDLQTMCQKLRGNGSNKPTRGRRNSLDKDATNAGYNHATAFDLLHGLLDLNPHTRLTADQALQHVFFQEDIS